MVESVLVSLFCNSGWMQWNKREMKIFFAFLLFLWLFFVVVQLQIFKAVVYDLLEIKCLKIMGVSR